MSDYESEEEIVNDEEELEDSENEEDEELTIKELVSYLEDTIIRTKKIVEVPKDERRTSNYISKTELVGVIGDRAAMIEKGAPSYTEIGDLKNPIHIAVKEMLEGQNPQKIQRIIRETDNEKIVEIWSVREMVANLENYSEIVPDHIFQKIQDTLQELDSRKSTELSKSSKPNESKLKKGGSDVIDVPPIVYWYNGTNREKYLFTIPELFEKIDLLANSHPFSTPNITTNQETNETNETNETDKLEEIIITLTKRSEYEKLLLIKELPKIKYYIEVDNNYPELTRMLATVVCKCGDVMIDIKIKNTDQSLLFLCALQVLNYYYTSVDVIILMNPENPEKPDKSVKNTKTIRINAKDKKTIHHFYARSLINLIDLSEVNSIFLVSDLIRL